MHYFLFLLISQIAFASGTYNPKVAPLKPRKPVPTFCYIKMKPELKEKHAMCRKIFSEDKCLIKKADCKWQSNGKCEGKFFRICIRKANRICAKLSFYPWDKDFIEAPNPRSQNYICDDNELDIFVHELSKKKKVNEKN